MGDKYDFSDELNWKWLDYKIDESNKHIVNEINKLKEEIKKLDESIIELKGNKRSRPNWFGMRQGEENIRIDIMDLENF